MGALVPPDLHGFCKWVFDALGLLIDFVRQVVVARRDSGLRGWASWLREDFGGSALCLAWAWFCASLSLSCHQRQGGQDFSILVEPHLTDAEFRKAWMPYFCRSGHPVVAVEQPVLDLPGITGQDLLEVAWAKKSTAGGLVRAPGMRFSPCPWQGSLLVWLSSSIRWKLLLDSYIAMIRKVDGDSAPLGWRSLCVLPVVESLWSSHRLAHLKDWIQGWIPQSVFSLGNAVSSVEAWFSTAL